MLECILVYERDLFLWLNGTHTRFWDEFIWLYSGKIAWIPLVLVVFFVFCYKKDWRESVLILLFIALVITLCDQFASSICKPLFCRLRPTRHPDFMNEVQIVFDYRGGKYGFISSHAANAFGFAAFTLLLFKYRWYTIAILLWGLIMGYSRIYLGVHFISDIIPGILAGFFWGVLGYSLYVPVRQRLLKTEIPSAEIYSKEEKNAILFALLITIVLMSAYSFVKASNAL